MKHQVHFGTDSGIVSTQAATQITMLITDLTRTVDVLDACIAAEENRLRPDDAIELDTRRHNLMVTIASLEDRLGSIEKMLSREAAQVNSILPPSNQRLGLMILTGRDEFRAPFSRRRTSLRETGSGAR